MRPERFLGHDPAPGDLAAVDQLAGVLREVVVALSAARRGLDEVVGADPAREGDLAWQGAHGRGLLDVLTRHTARLRRVEDALVGLARALESWRADLATHQDSTARLTEEVSQLSGRPDAGALRDALLGQAAELGARHTAAAGGLAQASEQLAEVLADSGSQDDLAADLASLLGSLAEAVEQWLAAASDPVRRAVESLDEAHDLTSVVTSLVGFDGGVSALADRAAAHAPSAARTRAALHRDAGRALVLQLPAAGFERVEPTLAQRVAGRLGSGSGEQGRGRG